MRPRRALLALLFSAAMGASAFGQAGVLKPRVADREPDNYDVPRASNFADAMAGAAAHLLPSGPGVEGTTRMPRRTFAQSSAIASNQLGYEIAHLAERVAGVFRPQRVIDNDWERVTNTKGVPYRAVCYIEITWPHKEQAIGTAFFVGKRVLLTNAHALYDREADEWATSVRVFPGQNADVSPYGSAVNSDAYIPTDYIGSSKDGQWDYDIGWIILPSHTLYDKVGYYFGYMQTKDADLKTMNLNSAGYPGAKNQQQWSDYETKSQIVFPMQFDHYHDVLGGSSGSPMYWMDDANKRSVVGIIASSGSQRVNGATRITKTYFNWTKDFKKQYP